MYRDTERGYRVGYISYARILIEAIPDRIRRLSNDTEMPIDAQLGVHRHFGATGMEHPVPIDN